MAKVTDLTTLAKTSVTSDDFLLVANNSTGQSKKLTVESLFPAISTGGSSSETIYTTTSLTNKNQIVFKGIKSGDTGLLTVATSSNNIELTVLEAGIDLSLCNNTTSSFLSSIDFTGTVTGTNDVVHGGTGLSSITKGSILYASLDDTLAASTPMSTNGQLLIGNATNGYPSVATLTAGTGVTITNGAGSITISASISSVTNNIDLLGSDDTTYNIDTNNGNGWISGDGTDEGIAVNNDGKVFIGQSNPTASFDDSLNIKGGIRFTNDTSPTIKPSATTSTSAGQAVTIQSGDSANAAAGTLTLKGGTASGTGNGGNVIICAGRDTSGSNDGIVKIDTYTGGTQTNAVSIAAEGQDVTISTGDLIIGGAEKGIKFTNKGTVTQSGDAMTEGVAIHRTAGVITLAPQAISAGANVEFTVDNNLVTANSIILLTMQDENTTNNAQLSVCHHSQTSGSFIISVHNPAATGTTSATASKIHFLVIN